MGQKWHKMTKKSKNFRKFFLVGIDLEWSKTCFKTKLSILKNFPPGDHCVLKHKFHPLFFDDKIMTYNSKNDD